MTDTQDTSVPTVAANDAATATDAPTTTAATESTEKRKRRQPTSSITTLPAYAIIETGGKQYRVSVGDVLSVEKLDLEAGSDVTFDRVLLVGGDGATKVGAPTIAGASVVASVEAQYRGEKIIIFKYKPKKRYRRRTGHRQSLTRLAITAINA